MSSILICCLRQKHEVLCFIMKQVLSAITCMVFSPKFSATSCKFRIRDFCLAKFSNCFLHVCHLKNIEFRCLLYLFTSVLYINTSHMLHIYLELIDYLIQSDKWITQCIHILTNYVMVCNIWLLIWLTIYSSKHFNFQQKRVLSSKTQF